MVEIAFGDQGYTGDQAAADAAEHGLRLEEVKLTEAKRGFVLLPRRWRVERSFAWIGDFAAWREIMSGCHKHWRDLHFLAFALLMLNRFVQLMT